MQSYPEWKSRPLPPKDKGPFFDPICAGKGVIGVENGRGLLACNSKRQNIVTSSGNYTAIGCFSPHTHALLFLVCLHQIPPFIIYELSGIPCFKFIIKTVRRQTTHFHERSTEGEET